MGESWEKCRSSGKINDMRLITKDANPGDGLVSKGDMNG
jgi:hypothetical protein